MSRPEIDARNSKRISELAAGTRPVNRSTPASRVPRLLSVKAVAEATTVPATTIYTMIARGDIECVRIGRAVRIREDDLVRWIETHRERAS